MRRRRNLEEYTEAIRDNSRVRGENTAMVDILEKRFEATPELLQRLEESGNKIKEISFCDKYYDTTSLTLAVRGVYLRVRGTEIILKWKDTRMGSSPDAFNEIGAMGLLSSFCNRHAIYHCLPV